MEIFFFCEKLLSGDYSVTPGNDLHLAGILPAHISSLVLNQVFFTSKLQPHPEIELIGLFLCSSVCEFDGSEGGLDGEDG